MRLSARSIALAAALLLGAGLGCRQAPEATPVAEEPGRAVIYPDGAQAEARYHRRVWAKRPGKRSAYCSISAATGAATARCSRSTSTRPPTATCWIATMSWFRSTSAATTRTWPSPPGYGIPITKGVPALAVLDAGGQVVYSQRNGEFESMGRLDPTAVTVFPAAVEGLDFDRPSGAPF